MKKEKISFKVDSNWSPSKSSVVNDNFIKAIVATTKKLEPGQSFPVSVADMAKRYGHKKTISMANAIRYVLQKNLSNTFMSKISVHEVKEGKEVITIRVRHK